ncbi:VWA domain-containing protein [Photobacterium angustum]|uniref:VWFA domain-containing protein n=1 Tax=Photobacterium angustum TaxID=661 RepID=A0ABX5GYZ2_PHOAN|nr:VWA domain-containing protein [Photobacterium angustum]PSX03968.1 hypothetical protein C0W27_20965 [Photobacterium angustum]
MNTKYNTRNIQETMQVFASSLDGSNIILNVTSTPAGVAYEEVIKDSYFKIKCIEIPAADFTVKKNRVMAEQVVVHESLHHVFTDFDVYRDFHEKSYKNKDFIMALANCIEDPFIEYMGSLRWKGVKNILDRGVLLAKTEGLLKVYSEDLTPDKKICLYVIYWLYVHRCNSPLADLLDDIIEPVKHMLGKSFTEFDRLVKKGLNVNSSSEILDLSFEISDFITSLDDEDMEDSTDDSSGDDQQSDEDSNGNSSGDDQQSDDDSNGDSSGGDQQSDDDSNGESSGADQQSGDDSNGDSSGDDQQSGDSNGESSGADQQSGDDSNGDSSGDDQQSGDSNGDSSGADQQSGDSNGNSSGDDQQSGDSNGDSSGGDQQSGDSNGDSSGGDQQSGDSNGGEKKSVTTDTRKISATELKKAIKKSDGESENLTQNMIDQLVKSCEETDSVDLPACLTETTPLEGFSQYCQHRLKTEMQQLHNKFLRPLDRQLKSKNWVKRTFSNRGGVIEGNRLYRALTDGKCLKNEVVSKAPNTAVVTLVDKSASMKDTVYYNGSWRSYMDIAELTMLSFCKALKRLNIKNAAYGFGWSREVDGVILSKYKSFDEKTDAVNLTGIEPCGSTPTGEALMSVIAKLKQRTEKRKIVYVLTDGDPDCPDSLRTADELATAFDIEVYYITICLKWRFNFAQDRVLEVMDPSELVNKLQQLSVKTI